MSEDPPTPPCPGRPPQSVKTCAERPLPGVIDPRGDGDAVRFGPETRTSRHSWPHGAFRGRPCSLRSNTGYGSLPRRSEGSPLPGSPRGLPLVRPSPAGEAQCPLWVPGPHGGLRPPFRLHPETRLCVPVPKAALGNHRQSHCPAPPRACPTQAGHVAHGAARARDTSVRPRSRRNRSQGATPTERRTRGGWAWMCRAWAPLPVFPRGEDEATVMRGPGTAAQKPPPVLAQGLESFRPRSHFTMKTRKRLESGTFLSMKERQPGVGGGEWKKKYREKTAQDKINCPLGAVQPASTLRRAESVTRKFQKHRK